LAEAIGVLVASGDPQDVEDYLRLITVAADVETQSRRLLHDAVAAARSSGATWAAIGSTLGMSKQAAQKRFPVAAPTPSLDPDERILGPVTAFDEMKELAVAGRYGWNSVEFGPFYHRVVRTSTQWEHRRVSMLRRRVPGASEEGWQVVGSTFPYTYLKRDLGVPALPEPG
ncbi:MAG: hypothetical protein ABIQ61_14915, partial [Ornithinibacter sp.]